MRPQGHASVDPNRPSAHAICDRCGGRYLHRQLQWQFQWSGTKLQNLRLLVCPSCMDKPNEQLRTILIPPDPVPILNPRLENYTSANNPLSPIAISSIIGAGDAIGTMAQGGGLNAAFDRNTNKGFAFCASLGPSTVGYFNTVGKNWGVATQPITADATTQTYNVSRFITTAPNNTPFLASGAVAYRFEGSTNNTTWTSLYTGTTTGTNGESIDATPTGGDYQYHRINFLGDGVSIIAIAQLALYASQPNSGI